MSALPTTMMTDDVTSLSPGHPASRSERGLRIAFGLLIAAALGLSAACLTYAVVQNDELAAGYGPSTPVAASVAASGHAVNAPRADAVVLQAM